MLDSPDSRALFIALSPSRKPGRKIWVRRSSIVAIERDPDPADITHHSMKHTNNPSTLIRLAGSDYVHYVDDDPEALLKILNEGR